ncbi:hypothetical protein EDM53_02435 [Rickettsiales endosymbiont of Peranema trichophorum]|uniref:hypothetical protein n=1 Tax=Rickettsiales endosymbiont of Peranema trichophorum TaxID=2486577 RepID=UPI0010238163|nr:hypothetical protein [Rickettsiales endosymbiont of Peranema trichophorum]RZI47306.1 hypothetical protein EDM53_02435 [Rickettsiales endosymbiont of Peranema trichophorum]
MKKKKLAFWFPYGLLCAAALVFFSVYYYSYEYIARPITLKDVPLVRSDPSPVKMPPQNSGGVVFANQNRAIYNNIKANKSSSGKKSKNTSYKKAVQASHHSKTRIPDPVKLHKQAKEKPQGRTKVQKEKKSTPSSKSIFDFADVKVASKK